jgi:uncharacterized protein
MGLNPTQKVYLDTCIVIYLLEEHPQFGSSVRHAFESAGNRQFCISPLVELECLVLPLRTANIALIQRYESFFQQQISLDIAPSIYRQAAELRSRHRLKTPDALHLATAHHYECTEFWTNDDRLSQAATNKAINLLSGLRT